MSDPGDGYTSDIIEARTAESLGDAAKRFREKFISEYIKDFNGRAALTRCGFEGTKESASVRVTRLLAEPYVANRLHEVVKALRETDIVTRGQVMARMWEEANDYTNSGKVRVSALAHIANMLGMTKHKEEAGVQPIGVVLIPMVPGDDWNLLAAASQKALKQGEVIDIAPAP
jgi:hypothetical protein